jgi:hypothetical protein
LLLYSSNLLLGFPTGRSFTTHNQAFWHHHHSAITPPSPPSPPHDYGHHNTSPSRSPPSDLGRPSPPPAAKDTKRKRASKNPPSMSSKRRSPPKHKLSPLPKVPHANLPIRPYDRTPEENARIAKEHYDAQIKRRNLSPARNTPRSKKNMQNTY